MTTPTNDSSSIDTPNNDSSPPRETNVVTSTIRLLTRRPSADQAHGLYVQVVIDRPLTTAGDEDSLDFSGIQKLWHRFVWDHVEFCGLLLG